MATTAPFVKLLRQLSRAKDEYRSGALDIAWDDGRASIFLVFGQPNHATFEGADGQPVEGQDAITAMVTRLPRQFDISPWRKVVVRTETLNCTLDELMEPFAQLAGAASSADSPPQPAPAFGGGEVGTAYESDLDFGLEDFPLLPLGQSLWSEAAAAVVHLDVLVPTLPDALIVLTGPKLRAAAVVAHGQIIDAVWVDDQEHAVGEGAAMALMGAREGTVSGYRLDGPRTAEALTMLWRCPIAFRDLRTSWIDADAFLAELEAERRDCVLLISNPGRVVALWSGGVLVAAYSDEQRQPTTSPEMVRRLIAAGGASLTLRQRAAERNPARLPEESFHAFVEGPAPATTSPSEPEVEPADAAPDAAPVAVDTGDDLGRWQAEAPPSNGGSHGTAAVPGWRLGAEAEPHPEPDTAHDPDVEVPDSALHGWPTSPAGSHGEAGWGDADPAQPTVTGGESLGSGPDPAGALDTHVAGEYDADDIADPAELAYGASSPAHAGPAAASETPAGHPGAKPLGATTPSQTTDSLSVQPDPYAETSRLGADFESVKNDLIQIGVLWLGEDQVGPVADLIRRTKPSVDDFISTIDAVKVMALPGHDPSVIRAMAREMHYHAAEYLCGA